MDVSGFLLAIVATIGFSMVVPMVATSTKKVGAVATMFLFQSIGIPLFVFLIPIMPPIPSETHIPLIMGIGALFTFVYILFLHATRIGSVAVVGTVNQLFMVVTTILGVLLLNESFTLWKLIGLLLTFTGILLLSTKRQKKGTQTVQLLKGVPHALVSAIGTGVYLFSIAMASRTDGWFLTALFIRIAIALTSGIILIVRQYNFSSLPGNAPWKLLALAGMCDVVAFSIYNYAIAQYEVSTITIITASQSAFIALFSWKFLGEHLTVQQILGLFVVLGGLISLRL